MTEEDQQGQDSVLHSLHQLHLDGGPPPPPLSPSLPSSVPTCTRWYYEMDMERSTELELTYHTIRRKKTLPMTIDSRSKYVRWGIPVPQSGTTYLDIVLGVKVRDMQFKAIESVVLTVEQFIGRRVITPQELERLCSNTIATSYATEVHDVDSDTNKEADSGIAKWKLKEQLLQSEGVFHAAIEVKTWEGANPDYGTIEIYFVETHSDAFRFYQHDPTYKEHRPYVFSVDVNNTGCPEIDRLVKKPNFVDSYVFSREGAHLAIDVLSKSGRFVILWQIRELPASDPRCIFQKLDKSATDEQHNKEDGKDFCPKIVAWLYFSKAEEEEASSVDLALSCNGTQVAILDKIRLTVGLNGDVDDGDKADNECCTAVYRFTPESVATGVFPTEAAAGSGFVRVDVADTCPNLIDFAGRAEFHIVAAKDPDPKDEFLVACDGVTIEIYSVFGMWSHVRTIILDPAKDMRSFRRNVFAALFKQLRGKHLVLMNAQGSKVSTWNIETGEEVSSCSRFGALEMWALSHVANVSRDGLLITIPGKDYLGIYETTTWNVVGWYRFPGVGRREYVGEGLFIRDDTQIMVAIESDEQPLYRRNRGYIIDIETLEVVDEFISSGTDIFRALPTKGHNKEQVLLLGVGNSTAYGFRLDDRVVFPPRPINQDDDHV
ncbi:hypothetical protein BGZ95_011264 [Linnemannia exigua]|uniref:Uncharacterized protein n=1 Tax=Linnemannia exigua TaxID=604196 RepID=A0AAD4H993_9FUNG|nr:hypothetical protein BGZ95_011264 [Linnemannia exigua]